MIKYSAPGSAMLMGEHAVLRGSAALVFALNRRVIVELLPRADRRISVRSALAEFETSIDNFSNNPQLSFVSDCISLYLAKLDVGFDLQISSDIKSDRGYGSSAAVVAATLAVLARYTEKIIDRDNLYKQGIFVIRKNQNGRGSGADLAASLFGGLLRFVSEPFACEKLNFSFNFVLEYCGFKTPTAEVVKIVDRAAAAEPKKFNNIFNSIAQSVELAAVAARTADYELFYQQIEKNQKLMEEVGLLNPELSGLIRKLEANPQFQAVKISGSGLGDSVIAISKEPCLSDNADNLRIDPLGLRDDSHE